MNQKLLITLLIFINIAQFSFAQLESYTVTLAPLSSDKYDEFSPVFYKNGIVFCTNRKAGSLTNYSSSQGKASFDINFIDTTQKVTWSKGELFSKELVTPFNEGPATFNKRGDTIYFARNLRVEGTLKELTGIGNKLGLFSAVLNGDKWEDIREFRFNSEWYNITTPFLSSDGKKLYFASDKPDGFGGSDLYYSQFKNGYWGDPVNLGPLINTKGNESYPYISDAGEFFFSSDGHKGLGGKDIFVTKQRASGWYPPERLEAPLNSEFDDFGIVSNPLTNEGFFSSNRGSTIDVYYFKSDLFQFWFSELQRDNQYCLSISDTGSIIADQDMFKYVWNIGEDVKIEGRDLKYCFPGSGNYKINLDLVEKRTGNIFFRKLSYEIDISEIDQPFITSPDAAVTGETINLDGLKSNCSGYEITGYFWDFGDGSHSVGEGVSHKFIKNGEFDIRLGLNLKSKAKGEIIKRVVSKKIRIFQTDQEKEAFLAGNSLKSQVFPEIDLVGNVKIREYYSAEADVRKDAVFNVVINSSPTRIDLKNVFFSKVPSKYDVRELYDSDSGVYSYIADRQMSLVATLPAYNEMTAAGYRDSRVQLVMLKEPSEKELYNIMKKYGVSIDNYFDAGNRLLTSAYIMLDQIAMLMSKYPGIKLEVGLHTDNQGVPSINLSLSEFRAQIIVNYLISRGISGKRMTAKGYGDTKPIFPNSNTNDRRLNRRVDFMILKE
jgi:outer membrane protein OmpA-like peptidoglycan-associated protein